MKNLLTKTLFILLLLSAVIPSGLQAIFFTESKTKFIQVALGAVLGQEIGGKIGSAIAMVVLDDGLGLAKSILAGEAGKDGAVIGAGIGAAVVELMLGTVGVGAIGGVGVGAAVGTRVGIEKAREVAIKMGLVSGEVTRIGAVVGAVVGIVIIKKLIEEYGDFRMEADEIIERAS